MKYWEDNTWRKPVVTRAWHTFAREQHFKFIKSAKGPITAEYQQIMRAYTTTVLLTE